MWVAAAGLQCCKVAQTCLGQEIATLLYISTLTLAYGARHTLSHMMRHIRRNDDSLSLMSASAKDQELPVLVIVADDMSAAFVSGSTTALAEEDRLVAGAGGGMSHAGKLKSMLMLGML